MPLSIPAYAWWLAALLLLWIARRPLLALVAGRGIGERVLAKQPAAIHLVPATDAPARTSATIDTHAAGLLAEGFTEVGAFSVPELPEFSLRLFVHPPEGWMATITTHARAGTWLEVNARFPDGTRLTCTDHPGTGLAALPGVESQRRPGAPAAAVVRAGREALARRGVTPMPIDVRQAPRVFEEGYASLAALRRQQGITRGEVVAVAMRPPARRRSSAA